MFGYVKAYIPELRIKEYELYRAGYCGVCKAMGKCTGCASRLTLTWDSVFLFFLRTALTRAEFKMDKGACIAHPFNKRKYIHSSAELDYAAKATAVMTYYKLLDDISDEHGAKGLLARIAMIEARPAKRKAELASLSAACEELLPQLSEIEKAAEPSFDKPADISARLTAELFASGLEKGSRAEIIAREIGYHTGKFIYAADAADDLSSDVKKGRYNPYAAMLGITKLDDTAKDMIRDALRCETGNVLKALDLIDFEGIEGIKAILYNIAYHGMAKRAEEILYGKKEDHTDERSI